MDDGFIAKGEIDDRSIRDVSGNDVRGFDRCHFFAGIGLWDYALRLAGWADEPVWTGSCPCQPFSVAGRQKGKGDDRHLWPDWQRLIAECRPAIVFGEQVATSVAHGWLDDVYQGLEAQGYAVGAAILPAVSVGAPHKRDRLWFVADHQGAERQQSGQARVRGARFTDSGFRNGSAVEYSAGSQGRAVLPECTGERAPWSAGVEWLACADGKKRLVKSGLRLLADGYTNRVLLLHCAGDAIVAQVASEFIQAYRESRLGA